MSRSRPRAPKIHHRGSRLAAFLLAGLIALASLALAPAVQARGPVPGQFDYYTLSLSWSPTYCASQAGQNDRQQCGLGRAYAFVVHGLWPQYQQGWPQDCTLREKWVPDDLIAGMLDIMPSKRLIIHEWKKHGGCSGLRMRAYFDLTRNLFAKIRIPARYLGPQQPVVTTPEQLVTDFVKTNRDLTSDMLSVQCGNSRGAARLAELRICFGKDGAPQSCGSNERRQCRAERLVLPPVRGGTQ
ncbi:ribonuclease T2 [Nordella sp. HKS 07]|uniref:ribonuclease T2 family protein n=1 Tax=Nordella sp. HKS 07 TaxID=2712222 RepID=UPI0013E10A61|nr:ribonuclease T2 [Nordella sp. HKS 07]QIG46444.1 ribonuclease T2 [Nordella sp. HKS 07]